MSVPDEAAGLFGPDSISWRIDRELAVLAGGSCALLMQVAHPVVAAGVAEHFTYATDPFGRLLRTLESSFEVVFGSRSTAEAAIRRVNAVHSSVRGRMPGGTTAYSARDPEALLWVHATLVDTALRVYGRFVSSLSAADEEEYHRESARIAVMLGVPKALLPSTIGALRGWMADRVADETVRVTPQARRIARSVLYPIPVVPRLAWDAAHLISLSTLPSALRGQYGIPWSAARERGVERIASVTRRILPLVPPLLRYAPQARAADRRVRQAGGSTR